MELTADEEAVVFGKSDNVSITELDVDSSTVVVVSSDDEKDSGDGDVLVTGAAVEEMVSVSLVRSGDNAMEETVSTSAEATSDVASGAVAVLESSAIVVGDSDRLADALRELTTGFVDAETISGAAADAEVTSSEDEIPTSVANALVLVTSVLVYGSSTDTTVVEEDGTGSVSNVLIG
ncbi:hypothetical protein AA0119_g13346 [Alternaria tenuissima]|uniref:Uncharacterized protein n=1 Tax=Alternaria tenuissima TaxID=119927 RepID=A0ABY0FP39_9PLEO|nr:hypothetical protein AA0119_g13346 [Alternaria tenuissima]